jgi:hypothetical protein
LANRHYWEGQLMKRYIAFLLFSIFYLSQPIQLLAQSNIPLLPDSAKHITHLDSIKSGSKKQAASALKAKLPTSGLTEAKSQLQQVIHLDTTKSVSSILNGAGSNLKAQLPALDLNATKSQLQQAIHIDTTKSVSSVLNNVGSNLKAKIPTPGLAGTQNKLQQATKAQTEKIDQLKKNISSLKKGSVSANLALENAFRYNPVTLPFGLTSSRRFANVVSVRGNIDVGGIPININYSTDQGSSMPPQGAINNNLFKFDFDPRQLKGMLGSDLMQYYDLRKTLFNGQDLTGYTQQALTDQLVRQNSMQILPQNVALAKYLDNPAKVNQLLTMNKEQIQEKLKRDLATEQTGLTGKLNTSQLTDIKSTGLSNLKLDQLKNYKTGLSELAVNKSLTGYLNDPAHVTELRNMNEEQIAAKIKTFNKQQPVVYQPVPEVVNAMVPVNGFDLNAMIGRKLSSQSASRDTLIKQTAHELFLSVRQSNTSGFSSIVAAQEKAINEQLTPVTALSALGSSMLNRSETSSTNRIATPGQIDSIATTITDIRATLEKKGLDVNRMLQMQQLLNQRDGNLPLSELGGSFVNRRPSNGMQSLFSNVEALKIGSFSNQVPGGVQNTDLFMDGAYLTYKAQANIPITVGYGTVNDISSFKDAQFDGSVYNQPRSITYITAEIKKARRGSLKISVISSYAKEIRNSNLYAVPTISNNNVAFTLSKGLNMGVLGNLGLDVSKTTTLYDNNYRPGAEAILDKKAGLSNDLSNNLFSAMSFGVKHQLSLTDLDASDNLYFNYAGMGYQNPANNGFGGARMKYGGSIKKSFDNRKLTFNLRSDLSNMPISYTSNDKWKNYQVQLDTRYQVNRKVTLSLKYTKSATDKLVDNIASSVYGFQKIQMDGNAGYKIGKYYSVSHFTLGTQNFSNTNGTQGGGNLLMFNYTQSVIIKKNTLTASLFYNKEMSSYQLIGNMLNSDVSYTYLLFNKLSLNSGITYFDNTGVARQAGLRQGIQLYAGGHFDLDSYVDIRKNLIRSLYPDLYPMCRAELSLKYHFKI